MNVNHSELVPERNERIGVGLALPPLLVLYAPRKKGRSNNINLFDLPCSFNKCHGRHAATDVWCAHLLAWLTLVIIL